MGFRSFNRIPPDETLAGRDGEGVARTMGVSARCTATAGGRDSTGTGTMGGETGATLDGATASAVGNIGARSEGAPAHRSAIAIAAPIAMGPRAT